MQFETMMNQTSVFIVFFVSILVIVSTAPNRSKRSTPAWHKPCGLLQETEAATGNDIEDIRLSLESIKLQHVLTMNNYLSRDYDFLYERVRIGVHEHQYIPNWVPGSKDVNTVRRLAKASPQMVSIF